MKVVIVSGGIPPTYKLLSKELEKSSYLICADSGANSVYNYNICPNLIVGDLDSINENALNYFKDNKTPILRYSPDKDFTDTEIAIDKAIELGAKEIVLLGCIGDRIDHSLGNIGMLLKCLKLSILATIKDNNNTLLMADKNMTLKGNKGDTFSILPYSNNVYDLSITGAKYNLESLDLEIGSALTVSNEFLEEEVQVTFTKGILLVIFPVLG
jgi:thiamine pyrophosphokinase